MNTSPPSSQDAAEARSPRRVVALGGGTGLPNVLRGFRSLLNRGELDDVVAVVTMTDDGGSSGRLRRSRGLPPPGDLRNCLVALAAEEDLMSRLFQHRYGGSEELGGHSVGNLILAALAEQTGSFLEAVELSSRVLRVVGRILPATRDTVSLAATMADGSVIVGETCIAASEKGIRRVALQPSPAHPSPGVLEAIAEADLVVIGPGSLFTSIVPNLLVQGIATALRETSALVVLVSNIVSEPAETAGLDLYSHLQVVERHAGGRFVDAVLVHRGPIDDRIVQRYAADGSHLLAWPEDSEPRVPVYRKNLLGRDFKIRHDPLLTVEALIEAWREARLAEKAR